MTTYATEIDQAAAEEARETATARMRMIANLRAFADALEQHPALPMPYSAHFTCYIDADTARAGRKGVFGWKKTGSPSDDYTSYTHTWGGEPYNRGTVTLDLEISKRETCTRVEVGTRTVEAQPAVEAHDVPVYRWECGKAEDTKDN